jgi:ubiquitin-activating enzyme E1
VYGLKGSTDAAFFRASLAMLPAAAAKQPHVCPPAAEVDAATEEADAIAACEQALAALPSPSSLAGFRLATLPYDADVVAHGDFVAAAAALRAVCYRIPAPDPLIARLSAGGVPCALQPTAALAAGLLTLEVCKFAAQPRPPLSALRCRFASLAAPLLVGAQPTAVSTARIVGAGGRTLDWSLWDRIELDARGLMLAEALARLEEQLGLRPSMVSHGKCLLYADFLAPAKRAERLQMRVAPLVEAVSKAPLPAGCRHLLLSVSVSDEQDEDVEVPDVRCLVL